MQPDHTAVAKPLHVLFLCTHNKSRSQIAEAIMSTKVAKRAFGRFRVASAGSTPGDAIHPGALRALENYGIDWHGHTPKSLDEVSDRRWDLIVTVCDRAKEVCPIVPGQPAFAHWGLDDPSEILDEAGQARAFADIVTLLARRIDLLLALPVEALERRALEVRVQHIAEEAPAARGFTVS